MMKKILIAILLVCIAMPNIYTINADENNTESQNTTIGEVGGYLEATTKTSANLYNERRFLWPGGHGFAAENANTLYEGFKGIKTKVVGGDNQVNGADRIIINKDNSIIQIQDKYGSSASQSVDYAFSNQSYRYIDSQGNPMKLEVPKDQYDEAVELFAKRIEDGQVQGVTDPSQAENYVKKGQLTYQQSINITKAGNIDSLKYDAANGFIVAKNALGIAFTIDFVVCTINGYSWEDSLKNAARSSIKAGVFTELIYIASSQLAKTGASSIFAPAANGLANTLGPQAQKTIMDIFGNNAQLPNVSNVSQILEKYMLVQAVIFAALAIPDVINLFNGRISSEQLAINLGTTFGGITGATVGMVAGSALGSLVIPGAGTTIGKIAGGTAGGLAGSWGASTLLTTVFKKDAEKMTDILVERFQAKADEFVITQTEADSITTDLQTALNEKVLKDMFQSEDREKFADDLLTPLFEKTIKERKKVRIPSFEETRNDVEQQLANVAYIH